MPACWGAIICPEVRSCSRLSLTVHGPRPRIENAPSFAKQRDVRTCHHRKPVLALRFSRPQRRTEQLAASGAGRDSAQQDVFVREVDDALREDQLRTAARRYGLMLGAVLILGLAALAGGLWWYESKAGKADEGSEKFVVALDQVEAGQVAPADAALAPLASEGTDGYRATSRLMRAGLAAEQGRDAEARKLLAEVASDGDAAQPFRDVATLREVALRFDSLPPEQVVARLKPLAVPGGPWFGSAGELVGAAYLKQGRADLAGPLFAAMAKDTTVPSTIRSRAQQLAGVLGVDAIVDPEKAAAAAGSPVAPAGQP